MGQPDRAGPGSRAAPSSSATATRPAPPSPPLEVLRKLAKALQVSDGTLLSEDGERGPDEDLRLQCEAVSQFDKETKKAAKALRDALILKPQARRWASAS